MGDVWTQKEKTVKGGGEDRNKGSKKKEMVIKKAPLLKAKKAVTGKKGDKQIRGDPQLRDKLKAIDDSLKVWVGGMAEETTAGRLRKHFAGRVQASPHEPNWERSGLPFFQECRRCRKSSLRSRWHHFGRL